MSVAAYLSGSALAPKRAIPFRTDKPFAKIAVNLTAPNGSTGQKIEFLGNGQQVVVAGIHPDTGKPYQWFGGEPGEFKYEDLPVITEAEALAFVDDAIRLLCDQYGYRLAARKNKTNGSDDASEDWGFLFDNIHRGVALHDSLRDLAAKMIVAGTNGGAVTTILRTWMDGSAGEHDARWRERYADIPRAVRTAEAKFGAEATVNDASSLFDPWQPFIVSAFPLDVLPGATQKFVVTQSDVIGCDPSGLAMVCLANFSAALDHRFGLKMMKHGNWWARPALWVLLVGGSSVKKTPPMKEALHELHAIQNSLRESYELELAAIKKADDGREPPPLPPRYIVNDTTIEKLADILARNPRGVLVMRDELAGWIGQMDKYGGASRGASTDRAFWLQAYDGGTYLVDRINRGETYVPNLSVSFAGGIQPNRLAELSGLTSDGLLQRFLPTMLRASVFTKDAPAAGPFDDYAVLTRKLVSAEPQRLVLDNDALQCMEDLRRHLHDIEQEAEGVAEGFPSFVGKLAGVAGSLALVLHMAARPRDGGFVPVTFDIVAKVSRLMLEFIVPHGFQFYRTSEATTDGDRLQRIASYILTAGKDRFVASDLTSNVAGLRGLSVFDLNKRVSPLVAGGWLIPEDKKDITNRAWTVAPAVRERFAARAADEERRKERLAELMGSPRKPKS